MFHSFKTWNLFWVCPFEVQNIIDQQSVFLFSALCFWNKLQERVVLLCLWLAYWNRGRFRPLGKLKRQFSLISNLFCLIQNSQFPFVYLPSSSMCLHLDTTGGVFFFLLPLLQFLLLFCFSFQELPGLIFIFRLPNWCFIYHHVCNANIKLYHLVQFKIKALTVIGGLKRISKKFGETGSEKNRHSSETMSQEVCL